MSRRAAAHQILVERAWQLIHVVGRWWPTRDLVFGADRREAVLEWLHQVSARPRASLINTAASRCRPRCSPPCTGTGAMRPTCLQGDRRPTLEGVLAGAGTQGSQLTIAPWYGHGPHEVEVTTDTAVGARWYAACAHPLGADS